MAHIYLADLVKVQILCWLRYAWWFHCLLFNQDEAKKSKTSGTELQDVFLCICRATMTLTTCWYLKMKIYGVFLKSPLRVIWSLSGLCLMLYFAYCMQCPIQLSHFVRSDSSVCHFLEKLFSKKLITHPALGGDVLILCLMKWHKLPYQSWYSVKGSCLRMVWVPSVKER